MLTHRPFLRTGRGRRSLENLLAFAWRKTPQEGRTVQPYWMRRLFGGRPLHGGSARAGGRLTGTQQLRLIHPIACSYQILLCVPVQTLDRWAVANNVNIHQKNDVNTTTLPYNTIVFLAVDRSRGCVKRTHTGVTYHPSPINETTTLARRVFFGNSAVRANATC